MSCPAPGRVDPTFRSPVRIALLTVVFVVVGPVVGLLAAASTFAILGQSSHDLGGERSGTALVGLLPFLGFLVAWAALGFRMIRRPAAPRWRAVAFAGLAMIWAAAPPVLLVTAVVLSLSS
jgi:hypothetical protein